jgi:hypothetical protein
MGWVNDARERLAAGETVQVHPRGGSMRGRIEDGQLVTLAPVRPEDVQADDVVLVGWSGNYLLHLVKEVRGDQVLIGNNLGKVNGWLAASAVVGRVVAVEDERSERGRHQRFWIPIGRSRLVGFDGAEVVLTC